MFSGLSKLTLARAAILHDAPVYVQFYVTARCNLTCEQCNIIYANSDVRECTIDEIERIADNFARMKVAIVLLTGGEPFARKDLPQIIKAFESRGVHVRMQTNGYASEEQIVAAIEAGGKDISISLDSLRPAVQDKINGGFRQSWNDALRAVANFTKYLPRQHSFASFGCVLQRQNMEDIEKVIRFASKITWYTSLVPVHTTNYAKPRGFRTFDSSIDFREEDYDQVDQLIERVRQMRREGYLLYDSDQYLDDIKRFVKKQPITWRKHNNNVCDSPNLYFALLPNGEFAPCCDFRLKESYPAYDRNFPKIYREAVLRKKVYDITSACDGCMYGSYPEMTISMRFWRAKMQRVKTFITNPPAKNWPWTYEQLLELAREIQES